MKLPRMLEWLALSLFLLALIGWMRPEQLGVVVVKLANVTLFGYVGYWLDRSLFEQRVHQYDAPLERASALLRRALIVAAAVLAGALGL